MSEGDEIVHLLLASNQYYPAHDNTLRVFGDKERAEEICEELNGVRGSADWEEKYNALREKYEWLPSTHRQLYTVESYEVHE